VETSQHVTGKVLDIY